MAGGTFSAENAKSSEARSGVSLASLMGKNTHQAAIAASLVEVMEEETAAATAADTGAITVESHSACQDHCHPRGWELFYPWLFLCSL